MSRRILSGSIVGVLAAVVALSAQQRPVPGPPPTARDGAKAAPTVGTASIAGTVVTDDADHRPVYRALVSATVGMIGVPHSVVTNEAGQFVLTDLPAGTYSITAVKPSYVTTFYGVKRAGATAGHGVPVALLDGQHLTAIDLRLARGSVLSGTVREVDGRPAIGLGVQVAPVRQVNGERRSDPTGQGITTDDRGMYRVFGLPPGDYLISVRPAIAAQLVPGGSSRPITAEEVQWAQQATTTTGAGGPPPLTPPPAQGQPVAYAPVYFPGTADAAGATVVTVGLGEERDGLDFTVAPVPTATVSGQVFGVDGSLANGVSVEINAVGGDINDFVESLVGRIGARPSTDGTFSVTNVKPGRYKLTAHGTTPNADRGPNSGPLDFMSAMAGGAGGRPALWAQQEITVAGRDISGLTLHLQPGLTMSGTLVFETAAPGDPSQVRVMALPATSGASQMDSVASMMAGASASVDKNGAFRITGITPDRYRLGVLTGGIRSLIAAFQPDAAPEPEAGALYLKSALWKGRDLADLPVDLQSGDDPSGVVVTITDRPTVLRGTVRNEVGQPTPNFPIVVFSTDRALWFSGSRRVQLARVLSDGTFKVVGLPAGEYYVAALTELAAADLLDTAFLDTVAGASLRITLAAGETKVQDLKLSGG